MFYVEIVMEDDFGDFLGFQLLKKFISAAIHHIVEIFEHWYEFSILLHVDLFELFR